MKRLIYFLIALLGFGTACSVDEPDVDDVACAYAPLRCNYSVKARVVDEAGQAIPGIKVTGANSNFYDDYLGTTDENGVVDAVLTFYDGMLQSVRFDDVDGEANGGEFESLTIEPESYYDSEHYMTVCDLGDVTMTKVENEDK